MCKDLWACRDFPALLGQPVCKALPVQSGRLVHKDSMVSMVDLAPRGQPVQVPLELLVLLAQLEQLVLSAQQELRELPEQLVSMARQVLLGHPELSVTMEPQVQQE